jgi:WD40 repeat protein
VSYSPSGKYFEVLTPAGTFTYDGATYGILDFVPSDTIPMGRAVASERPIADVLRGSQARAAPTTSANSTAQADVTVRNSATSRDNSLLAMAVCDSRLIDPARIDLWDVSTKQLKNSIPLDHCPGPLVFSPDASLLASAYVVWTVPDLDVAHTFPPTSLREDPLGWAFSPDSSLLGVASPTSIRLFDVRTWVPVVEIPLPPALFRRWTIAFSPDGRRIAAASEQIYIWDLASGELQRRLFGDYILFDSLAWSPSGTQIAASSSWPIDGQSPAVTIWDSSSGSLSRTLTGFTSSVDTMVWRGTSRDLVLGYADGMVVDIPVVSGQPSVQGHIEHPNRSVVHRRAFSSMAVTSGAPYVAFERFDEVSDGRLLLASLSDTLVITSDLDSLPLVPAGGPLSENAHNPAFSRHGDLLAVFRDDPARPSVQVYSFPDVSLLSEWILPANREAVGLTFGHGDDTLYFGESDKWGRLYQVMSYDVPLGSANAIFHVPTGQDSFDVFSLSASKEAIAIGSETGSILIVDLPSTAIRAQSSCAGDGAPAHRASAFSFQGMPAVMSWSSDGALLAFGAPSGDICVFAARTGEVLQRLDGHSKESPSVAFSWDGTLLASASRDGVVRLWGLSP